MTTDSKDTPRDPQAPDPTAQKDPVIGLKLGDYVVQERLGAGGMGVVYRGLQALIGKEVAIKVLQADLANNPEETERLIAEARLVNAIGHRGIVDIYSTGSLPDGRQYLVMELLRGEPLDQVVDQRGPLKVVETLGILDEICDALSAAHGAGVIHRDLKPNNVFLVTPPHGARYLKLLDFGLAKRSATPHGSAAQTRASIVVGTPYYMAPEQARGQSISPQTDLYALGCMAFELLTGKLPFDAPTPFEVISMHLNSPAPRVSDRDPSVPEALDELVARLLAKVPSDRPSSAAAVRSELNRIKNRLQTGSTGVGQKPIASLADRRTLPHLGLPPGNPTPVPPEATLEYGRGQARASASRKPAPVAPLQPPSVREPAVEHAERTAADPSSETTGPLAAPRIPKALLIGGAVLVLGMAAVIAFSRSGADDPLSVAPKPLVPQIVELKPPGPDAQAVEPEPDAAEEVPATDAKREAKELADLRVRLGARMPGWFWDWLPTPTPERSVEHGLQQQALAVLRAAPSGDPPPGSFNSAYLFITDPSGRHPIPNALVVGAIRNLVFTTTEGYAGPIEWDSKDKTVLITVVAEDHVRSAVRLKPEPHGSAHTPNRAGWSSSVFQVTLEREQRVQVSGIAYRYANQPAAGCVVGLLAQNRGLVESPTRTAAVPQVEKKLTALQSVDNEPLLAPLDSSGLFLFRVPREVLGHVVVAVSCPNEGYAEKQLDFTNFEGVNLTIASGKGRRIAGITRNARGTLPFHPVEVQRTNVRSRSDAEGNFVFTNCEPALCQIYYAE
jgi:serine/threonine-protein kinase